MERSKEEIEKIIREVIRHYSTSDIKGRSLYIYLGNGLESLIVALVDKLSSRDNE